MSSSEREGRIVFNEERLLDESAEGWTVLCIYICPATISHSVQFNTNTRQHTRHIPPIQSFAHLSHIQSQSHSNLTAMSSSAGNEVNPLTGKALSANCKIQRARAQNLPVSKDLGAILEKIKNSNVTILVGETGSGKTTQVPPATIPLLRNGKKTALSQNRRLATRMVNFAFLLPSSEGRLSLYDSLPMMPVMLYGPAYRAESFFEGREHASSQVC